MKILHSFILFSIEVGGGTPEFIYQICKGQAKAGIKPTVLSGSYAFDQVLANKLDGVDFHVEKTYLHKQGFSLMPGLILWCRNNLQQYDVVHMHGYRTFQNLVLYYYCRKYNIPYVMDAHGSAPYGLRKVFLKKMYDYFFGKKILKESAFLLAVCKKGVEEYKSIVPDLSDHSLRVFYPSFDSNIVGKIRQAYSCAQQTQSSSDAHTIAYLALVGSLVHEGKNTTALTRASLKTKTMECGYFDVEEFIQDVKNSPVSRNIRKTIHAAISYVCNMGFIIPIENTSLVHKKGNWVSGNLELNLKVFVLIEKKNINGDRCVLFAVSGNPGNIRSANATKPPLEEWASLAISTVFFPQNTPIKIGILNIAESYIVWWPISLQDNVTKICTDAVFFECIR